MGMVTFVTIPDLMIYHQDRLAYALENSIMNLDDVWVNLMTWFG